MREDDFLASPGIKSDPTGPGPPGAALHLSTLPVAHMRSWPLRTRGRVQGVGPTGTAAQRAALHREDEGRGEAGDTLAGWPHQKTKQLRGFRAE